MSGRLFAQPAPARAHIARAHVAPTHFVLACLALLCLLARPAVGAAQPTPPAPSSAPSSAALPLPAPLVMPAVAFPENGLYSLTVLGAGLTGCTGLITETGPSCQAGQCLVAPFAGGVRISAIPHSFAGAHKLRLSCDRGLIPAPPDAALAVSFSWVEDPLTPRLVAAALAAALLALVGLLLRGGRSRRMANGDRVPLVKALFIDPATSTYSLSKLQFYLWTLAGVTGYIYLSVAKSLVQGSMAMAHMPGNLPGVLLVSVGTGVLSSSISSLAGTKGAGSFQPLPSDLITSGGVVAPERLQFLLWTVLGSLFFLADAFAISPAQIDELPQIPTDFLQLMGISSAGYLGGKIGRGPGPVIKAVQAVFDGAVLTLTIDGTMLGTKGSSFFLCPLPNGRDAPLAVTIDPAGSVIDANGNATRLVFSAPVALLPGRYELSIINADGEKAVWEFDLPMPVPGNA